MKITGVRTQLYEIPMTRLLGDANSPQGRRRWAGLAVFLDTDAGITGLSLAAPAARGHIHAFTENLLAGRDPRGVKGLWKKMVDFVFKGANRGIVNDAIGPLDVAMWDIKAKANGEPLWKTLGASSRRVKAYASGIDLPLPDDELYAFYEGMAKQGVSAGKVKIGLDREMDMRRIGVMRDALATSGKTPALMVDANEYWSPKQAIRHVRAFEERYDLTWVEEPARRWDTRGLRQVSEGIRAAVATGENLDEPGEFAPLIANGAADVYQIGVGTSGITGAMQVAHLAYAFELPVSMMNCPANYMAHLAAALPNHSMMEVVAPGWDVVLQDVAHRIEDGWIVLGDAPGLGFTFDEAALAKYAVEKPSPDAGASPWGRRRGAGLLYEVGPDEPNSLGEE